MGLVRRQGVQDRDGSQKAREAGFLQAELEEPEQGQAMTKKRGKALCPALSPRENRG